MFFKLGAVEFDAQAKQLKDELEHQNRVFKSRLELEEEARLSPTTAKMDFAINKTEEKSNPFSIIENFAEEIIVYSVTALGNKLPSI